MYSNTQFIYFFILFTYLVIFAIVTPDKTQYFNSSLLYWDFWLLSIWINYHQKMLLESKSRHFSHVIKSCIFKNLNLRQKADRNFRRTFLKNRFWHLKLYSNPPSWLVRGCCHKGTFWKTKDLSSHFWEGQPFRFWYVEWVVLSSYLCQYHRFNLFKII